MDACLKIVKTVCGPISWLFVRYRFVYLTVRAILIILVSNTGRRAMYTGTQILCAAREKRCFPTLRLMLTCFQNKFLNWAEEMCLQCPVISIRRDSSGVMPVWSSHVSTLTFPDSHNAMSLIWNITLSRTILLECTLTSSSKGNTSFSLFFSMLSLFTHIKIFSLGR